MPTIYIAGDSTAASKLQEKRPEAGWGECLHLFLNERYQVENYAENGKSARSFIAAGLLDKIASRIRKNDVLLIQFGHNDQKKEDPLRFSEALGDYQDFLGNFIEVASKNHAIPVLLSAIARRKFLDNGKPDPFDHGRYPASCLEVARNHDVAFIDMHKRTLVLYEELGEEKSKSLFLHLEPGESPNYPQGITDNTHLNRFGALIIASIIAEELIGIL
jgi:lysophospholipase L1-like esterase